MLTPLRMACSLGLCLFAALPAGGSMILLDDFNRPVGTAMGPNWYERAPDFGIVVRAGTDHAAQSTTNSLMTFQGNLQGLDAHADWFSVEAINDPSRQTPEFAGIMLRYADNAQTVFVKVQDGNGDGLFERVFFYLGFTGSPWPNMTGGSFSQAITATGSLRLAVRVSEVVASPPPGKSDPGAETTLNVTVLIDRDLDGVWDENYTRGGLAPGGLGTGVGLAGSGWALMDNFGGYIVPDPGTALLLPAAFGMFAGRKRRRPNPASRS